MASNPIWQKFEKSKDDSKFVKCLICAKYISLGGHKKSAQSTSSAKRHLKNVHPEEFAALFDPPKPETARGEKRSNDENEDITRCGQWSREIKTPCTQVGQVRVE